MLRKSRHGPGSPSYGYTGLGLASMVVDVDPINLPRRRPCDDISTPWMRCTSAGMRESAKDVRTALYPFVSSLTFCPLLPGSFKPLPFRTAFHPAASTTSPKAADELRMPRTARSACVRVLGLDIPQSSIDPPAAPTLWLSAHTLPSLLPMVRSGSGAASVSGVRMQHLPAHSEPQWLAQRKGTASAALKGARFHAAASSCGYAMTRGAGRCR